MPNYHPVRRLTTADKMKGVSKAIRSRKTPKWLKPSLRRYLRKLQGEMRG